MAMMSSDPPLHKIHLCL